MKTADDSDPVSLDQSWTYKVTVLADQIARRIAPIVTRASGLNLSQWRVIAAIADQPGRSASQVVEITPMDKGIVSRAVATLVKRDLIERRPSRQDGRLSHLFLTREGEAVFALISAELDHAGLSGRPLINEVATREFLDTLDRLIDTLAATDHL